MKMRSIYAGGTSIEELFHGLQPHIALGSLGDEHEYMRKIAEVILQVFFPSRELQSDLMRYLLREVLAETVLMNLVETISEPDTIFELILSVSIYIVVV
jgi:hypothetical protein